MTDNCPNHDDTQICPDCTYRAPSAFQPINIVGTLTGRMPTISPLEQHKADLEMIITVCQLNAGVDAPDAYERIAELAKSLLDRLPKS